MRPVTKYSKGDKMRDCIFLEELDSIILNENSSTQIKFVKRIGVFQCSCGNKFKAAIVHIRNGNVKSCGCLRDTKIKQQGLKNKTHGLRSHPLYPIWVAMIRRCEKTKDINYHRYGKRGIKVCERWHDINNFIEDMYPTYSHKLQIDRTNNNGNYEPSNCKWITRKENANNTRRSKYIEYKGIIKTMSEWADYLSIPYYVFANRVSAWDLDRAFITPYLTHQKSKINS
jgi:hypothetical protein